MIGLAIWKIRNSIWNMQLPKRIMRQEIDIVQIYCRRRIRRRCRNIELRHYT